MSRSIVIAFSGDSGSGKTTLLTRLVALDAARGLRTACIKHTHHGSVTPGGGDSARLLAAGAVEAIVAGEWGALRETDRVTLPWTGFDDLVRMITTPVDRIYVEGFRSLATLPRVQVFRDRIEDSALLPATIAVVAAQRHPRVHSFRPAELAELASFLDTIAAR